MAAPLPVLYTEDDAAEYLRLSPRTLQRWRITGDGPEYVKLGKRVFYTDAGLAAFVDRCRRQTTRKGRR